MARISFRDVKLSPKNKERLSIVNEIIKEYQAQDLVLTLRQLYYQLVSRDVIPNKQSEYAKLSTLLKEGRMGGIVDWDAIEDRLRKPYTPASFETPQEIIEAAHKQYRKDRMRGQDTYIEVWVEKDALSGVLKRVTSQYGVPILVNRGYSSCSSMFDSYNRFKDSMDDKSKTVILYLGDYDPSGIDMIRDIKERTREFFLRHFIHEIESEAAAEQEPSVRSNNFIIWFDNYFEIVPIALTRAQIDKYDPPENPAKRTDPRAKEFIKKHGSSSWEVDALRPEVLNSILKNNIEKRIDLSIYEDILEEEKEDRNNLEKIKDNYDYIINNF